MGAFVPLGVGGQLVGGIFAWLIQPYLSFLAALLGLTIYGLASRLITSPAIRALVAIIAPQAALLYGYALWGAMKELAAAALIALVAALVPPILQERASAPEPPSRSP